MSLVNSLVSTNFEKVTKTQLKKPFGCFVSNCIKRISNNIRLFADS